MKRRRRWGRGGDVAPMTAGAGWAPVAGAVATGALLGLFARVEGLFVPLGFAALVPLLLGLDRLRSALAAIAAAVLATVVFATIAFSWFPAAIAGYAGSSAPLAWGVAVLLGPVLIAPHIAVYAIARHAARRFGAGRAAVAAVGALTWVAAEWALPRVFADTLGYGLHPWATLRQAADLAGARGLTLLLVVVNECIAAAIAGRRLRPIFLAAAPLLAAALVYGAARGRQIEARLRGAPTFAAGVVQANITRYDKLAASKGQFETVNEILRTHFELSRQIIEQSGPIDLLVWPETVYPTTFGAPRTEAAAELDGAIRDMVRTTGVPLVFGAFEREAGREFNAAFFLGPRPGGEVGFVTYRKSILFPMTEHVPGWLDGDWLRGAMPWAGRWTAGPGPRVVPFALRGGAPVRAAPLICYEVTDPDYVAAGAALGADLILTLSNDAWFPDQAGPRLHLIVAAFRSIETRLPQLRATNSGLSALIGPTGQLRDVTRFDERAAFRVDVPRLPRTATLVVAWGDWLGLPCAIAAALLVAWTGLRRIRGGGRARVPPPSPPPGV